MSGQVVGWAMRQVTGSPPCKLVLAKLADNAGDDGLAWPSIALITQHTELGQSTVYRHLAALQAKGLIEPTKITVHPGTSRAYTCDGWQLNVPAEWRILGGRKTPAKGKSGPVAAKAIPVAGRPYKEEPSLEPSMNPHSVAAPAFQARVDALRVAIGDQAYADWFSDSEFFDSDPVRIVVPREFKRIRIKERFWDKVARVFGDDVLVLLKGTADA